MALENPATNPNTFLNVVGGYDETLRQRLEGWFPAPQQPETLLTTRTETGRPTIPLELANEAAEADVAERGRGVVYVAEPTEPLRRRFALKVITLGMKPGSAKPKRCPRPEASSCLTGCQPRPTLPSG